MPKILLVDEKKDIRDFTARFFNDRNFEVLSAATGSEALLAVKKSRPEIVLLELQMRDMDGIEVLRRIMNVSRETRVVVVSSINDMETRSQAKRLGAVNYLTKPVALGELMSIVLKNLGRQKRFF